MFWFLRCPKIEPKAQNSNQNIRVYCNVGRALFQLHFKTKLKMGADKKKRNRKTHESLFNPSTKIFSKFMVFMQSTWNQIRLRFNYSTVLKKRYIICTYISSVKTKFKTWKHSSRSSMKKVNVSPRFVRSKYFYFWNSNRFDFASR